MLIKYDKLLEIRSISKKNGEVGIGELEKRRSEGHGWTVGGLGLAVSSRREISTTWSHLDLGGLGLQSSYRSRTGGSWEHPCVEVISP